MRTERKLSQGRLHSLLHYNPTTGLFTWFPGRRGARKNKPAGTIADGYRIIKVDYQEYRAARLAVFWMTGKWPTQLVDHRNCIRDDDRWENLRLANYQQNAANMPKRIGIKGISFDRATGRYSSRIKVNYRSVFLGRFDTPEQAHAAYVTASQSYFKEFARS